MENATLALQAYLLMGLPWDPAQVRQALLDTRITGRLDLRNLNGQGKPVALLLDVGHNPHAAEFLAGRLVARPVAGRRLAVFGLLADKDLDGVLRPLHAHLADWAVTALPSPRSRPAGELQAALDALGARVHGHESVAAALQAQCEQAVEGDEILVFGSFYCVAEALAWLAQQA